MGGFGPGGEPGGGSLEDLLGGGADIEQYLQNYEQMLQDGLAHQGGPKLNEVDAEGGITVRPEPGFVIKTREMATGMKVFVNMVANEHIEAPHMKSYAELEGEQGCRVPLSIGTPVEDFDKKKEPCVTYDVVANPDVIKEAKETPAFRDSLVTLGLSAVGQKYKIELDPKYKLPKMSYKGNVVQLQRMRVKKESQIQELGGSAPASGPPRISQVGGANDDVKEVLKKPDFCIFYASASASSSGAPLPDGFSEVWPAPPEDVADAAAVPYLNGLDLPSYRVNYFQAKVRGTMKNEADRQRLEEEEASAARETRDMLSGRMCVAQIRMPDLDKHVSALKQFSVAISDECLRITFPMLPRVGRCVHAPLTIWWPTEFYSAEASAEWDARSDTLTVQLPASAPEQPAGAEFDQDILDTVF
jgi:hypothetical protein